MRRPLLLFATLVFALGVQGVSAQIRNKKEPQQKELPSYFPKGVIQTTDPLLQLSEYWRNLAAQFACFQGREDGVTHLIPGKDSISVQTDIVTTANVLGEERKMKIVLDHYVRIGDKIRVTTLCDQYFITEKELKIDVEDLILQTKIARDAKFAYHGKLTDKAVGVRAKQLGISVEGFARDLDKRIPGTDITYREFNQLPKPQRPSDFVPEELHLGFSPRITGVLGVTWLNSGIVYYNQQGRVRDHIAGQPLVLSHEMSHVNPNLQRYPFTGGFDPELFASIPEMLVPDNKIDLFFHGYIEPLRALIRIYFGFDFEQAQKEIFTYDFAGQLDVDETKFRAYFGQLEAIKVELLGFSEDVVLPEYYSNPLWWMAMNDRRRDDNSIFRIMMAIHYDPTSKGGRENTMLWGEKNKPTIYRIAKESLEEMRTRKDMNAADAAPNVPKHLVDLYAQMFSQTERKELEEYFRAHPALLKELLSDPEKLLRFVEKFKAEGLKGGVR